LRRKREIRGAVSNLNFTFTGWSLLGICVQRENSWPSLMAFTTT
jgi:hypothetical protein